MGRVALAFSGGLDTTVCVPLLREEFDYDEVVAVTVNVGQPHSELAEAEDTARALGVEHRVVDRREEFAELCLDAVAANATYQGYPLGTALSRPVIARPVADVARETGCDALAHGCTGKGNDQLRIEAVWRRTEFDVVAPIREMGLTRKWERNYAGERGLPVEGGGGGTWSVDANLWSRSVQGDDLEDPSTVPPEDIYEWTDPPGNAAPETVEIAFENGRPVAVDGERMAPLDLVTHLNERAGAHGVGRTDLMEDWILGVKIRDNYEHPAATTLLTAHKALETLVLTKDQRSFKARVDDRWAEKAYEGLLDTPIVEALEAFVAETQRRVTGTVTVRLTGGHVRPVARESPYEVYSLPAASYEISDIKGIEQSDAVGVAKYHGFQSRLAREKAPADTEDAPTVDGDDDSVD